MHQVDNQIEDNAEHVQGKRGCMQRHCFYVHRVVYPNRPSYVIERSKQVDAGKDWEKLLSNVGDAIHPEHRSLQLTRLCRKIAACSSSVQQTGNGVQSEEDRVCYSIAPDNVSGDWSVSQFERYLAGHFEVLVRKHPVRDIEQKSGKRRDDVENI